MRVWKTWLASTLVVASLGHLVLSCASNEPRVKRERTFGGIPLDVSLLSYKDLATGSDINLKDYMERNELKAVLLMFGAAGCVKCTEKSKDLSSHYLKSHSLFLSPDHKGFELIGVTTDKGSGLKLFESRWRDLEQRKAWGYDFIRWIDPEGDTIKKYFLDAGEQFQVPFTILLSREGIMYRVAAHESRSVGAILDDVEAIISGQKVDPRVEPTTEPTAEPTVEPSTEPTGEPTSEPIAPMSGLDRFKQMIPSRFAKLEVTDCAGQKATLQDQVQDVDVALLHLQPSNCTGASCAANLAQMNQLESYCRAGASQLALQRRCTVVTVESQRNAPNAETCAKSVSHRVFSVSDDVFAAFSSHFDWTLEPALNPQTGVPGALPVFDKSMLFGFYPSGKMVLSYSGDLQAAAVQAELSSESLSVAPTGPDFQVYGDLVTGSLGGEQSFSEIHSKSAYTVVAGFDVGCGSCVEELQHWSLSGSKHLLDFCRSSQGFCSVVALETYPAYNMTPAQQYEEVKTSLASLNIRVPLVVDRQTFATDFSRFFEAYLAPRHQDWQGLPGSVIYDREGKIVASFRSTGPKEPDPILGALKYLQQMSRGN